MRRMKRKVPHWSSGSFLLPHPTFPEWARDEWANQSSVWEHWPIRGCPPDENGSCLYLSFSEWKQCLDVDEMLRKKPEAYWKRHLRGFFPIKNSGTHLLSSCTPLNYSKINSPTQAVQDEMVGRQTWKHRTFWNKVLLVKVIQYLAWLLGIQ